MIYPKNFEARIGFDTVRNEILHRCISGMGSDLCRQMHFSSSHDEVRLWLEQTNEFLSILTTKREFPVSYYFDMRSTLKTASAPGTFIPVERLFDLLRSLTTISEIKKFFFRSDEEQAPSYPRLRELAQRLNDLPEVADSITRVLDKNGQVKDSASPLLAELRRQLQSIQASMSGILRRIIAEGKANGTLDNDIQPSIRDGRLVIPVAPMHKRKVKGIVHDQSATGKTVFIEPEEIVEANNRTRETESEIAREIVRILIEVTDLIRPHLPDLEETFATLGKFDFIRAKALFCHEIDAQMPTLHPYPHIEWFHAIHPALWLSLRAQGKEVVPLNLELNDQQRILLISGPNAGGKSVCLKTVGVVQYMLQCGILPPIYSNSHVGIFEDIFIDIGDQQSIEDDLSTYSSHLQNMKTFLQRGGKKSLILIDEFGSGTEPQIGGAIAQAILEQLNGRGVMGVITTHYQNLKHFAEEAEGVVNGAMLYDRQHMQPLFQLSVGYPGSSFAIEIARKTGIPQAVIDKASEIVGSDYINMDKYLLDIVRDRKYWENKRRDIHAKEKKLDQIVEQYQTRLSKIAEQQREIIREAKDKAREMLQGSNAEIERTIKEIKEMQAEKEKTKLVRQQLNEFKQRLEQEQLEPTPALKSAQNAVKPRRQQKKPKKDPVTQDGKIQVGDNVMLKGSTSVGTVISIDEKYCLVAFGNLKTRVETSRVEKTTRKIARSETPSVSAATTAEIRSRQLNFSPDIDVRGMRADEAIQAVTYFIDDAIQFASSRVRILHGTGTGALREAIRQYLNTVNGVQRYHDEDVRLGGAGITVVDLK